MRALISDRQVAKSKAMKAFLLNDPIQMTDLERADEERRKLIDKARVEEQKRFFQIAQMRARDLDVYMERFRRDIVENSEFLLSVGVYRM